MRIGARTIGAGQPPYVIAELGVNHDGSPETALRLVDAAAAAGAEAIKLQWFRAEMLLSRAAVLADYQARAGAADPRSMLAGLELTAEQMARVVDRARDVGMHAIVTVFSSELVGEAERLAWDAYKTASPDLVNRPLLERLMTTGAPLIISTGAATIEEVLQAVGWLQGHPHLLMHCVSAYPVPDECAALAGREAMERVAPGALGYSDHTTATDVGAMAVAGGACVLEKHLTLDRAAPGPDHAASLEPAQLAEYVRLARRAHALRGAPVKRVLEIEREVRRVARQSLTTTRALGPGHVIGPADLTIKRPGTGLSPQRWAEAIGRSLRRAVEADVPLTEDDLA